jgi:hypothetical protein
LRHRARQEEYHHDRRRDPERSVQIRVAVEHIEEVGAWEDGRGTTSDDFVRVNVKILTVVMNCP